MDAMEDGAAACGVAPSRLRVQSFPCLVHPFEIRWRATHMTRPPRRRNWLPAQFTEAVFWMRNFSENGSPATFFIVLIILNWPVASVSPMKALFTR